MASSKYVQIPMAGTAPQPKRSKRNVKPIVAIVVGLLLTTALTYCFSDSIWRVSDPNYMRDDEHEQYIMKTRLASRQQNQVNSINLLNNVPGYSNNLRQVQQAYSPYTQTPIHNSPVSSRLTSKYHPLFAKVPTSYRSQSQYHPLLSKIPTNNRLQSDYHPLFAKVPTSHRSKSQYHPLFAKLPTSYHSQAKYHQLFDKVPTTYHSQSKYHQFFPTVPNTYRPPMNMPPAQSHMYFDYDTNRM